MSAAVDLRECEHQLAEPDELLWRQVHPRYVRGTLVQAEGFVGPSPGTSEISVVRAALVTSSAAEAYHRDALGLKTAGTWAVTVGEVDDEARGRTVDDGGCDDVDTPGHAFVDLRDLTRNERRVARAVLARRATDRGRFNHDGG